MSTNVDAVSRWIDTTADWSQITENIPYAEIENEQTSWTHKEGSPAWIKRDEKDITSFTSTVESMQPFYNPFLETDALTSIST